MYTESKSCNYNDQNKMLRYCDFRTFTSFCLECYNRFKVGKNVELFDNFGKQPNVIKNLTSCTEYSKLAIAALYCNTFRPTGYSYLHFASHVTWKDNRNILDGTLGVVKSRNKEDLPTNDTLV